ncbi:CLUMA_CG003498, isoform A [Clunio marinus]|uniref:CLUMA_CG003498, isoform A n=1 Tax=Clunio marinus TaxID=568069 RepID=A0A1J1HNW2_9DIPT|nr:CLUMA_CG003498, isoform A [Clunio marinus]
MELITNETDKKKLDEIRWRLLDFILISLEVEVRFILVAIGKKAKALRNNKVVVQWLQLILRVNQLSSQSSQDCLILSFHLTYSVPFYHLTRFMTHKLLKYHSRCSKNIKKASLKEERRQKNEK